MENEEFGLVIAISLCLIITGSYELWSGVSLFAVWLNSADGTFGSALYQGGAKVIIGVLAMALLITKNRKK